VAAWPLVGRTVEPDHTPDGHLLDASLTLEQALSALVEQSENETVRQVLAGVRAEVLAGHTFAKALGHYESIFPELYRALVTAGEASGELGRVMLRLADYTEQRHALRQKVVLAFIYPAIVTLVALLVVGGLLIYVVPQVIGVFEQSHQTLPLLTRSLIWVSATLQAPGVCVVDAGSGSRDHALRFAPAQAAIPGAFAPVAAAGAGAAVRGLTPLAWPVPWPF